MMITPIALVGSMSARIRKSSAKNTQDHKKTIREAILQQGIPEGEVGRIPDFKRMTRGRKLQRHHRRLAVAFRPLSKNRRPGRILSTEGKTMSHEVYDYSRSSHQDSETGNASFDRLQTSDPRP